MGKENPYLGEMEKWQVGVLEQYTTHTLPLPPSLLDSLYRELAKPPSQITKQTIQLWLKYEKLLLQEKGTTMGIEHPGLDSPINSCSQFLALLYEIGSAGLSQLEKGGGESAVNCVEAVKGLLGVHFDYITTADLFRWLVSSCQTSKGGVKFARLEGEEERTNRDPKAIVFILKTWMETYPMTLCSIGSAPIESLSTQHAALKNGVREVFMMKGFSSLINHILGSALPQSGAKESGDEGNSFLHSSSPTQPPKLLLFDCVDVARHFCLVEFALQKKLSLSDLTRTDPTSGWLKQQQLFHTGIAQFISLSFSEIEERYQGHLITHWIKIARLCLNLNNFSTPQTIYAGLSAAAESQIPGDVWEAVASENEQDLRVLESVFRPSFGLYSSLFSRFYFYFRLSCEACGVSSVLFIVFGHQRITNRLEELSTKEGKGGLYLAPIQTVRTANKWVIRRVRASPRAPPLPSVGCDEIDGDVFGEGGVKVRALVQAQRKIRVAISSEPESFHHLCHLAGLTTAPESLTVSSLKLDSEICQYFQSVFLQKEVKGPRMDITPSKSDLERERPERPERKKEIRKSVSDYRMDREIHPLQNPPNKETTGPVDAMTFLRKRKDTRGGHGGVDALTYLRKGEKSTAFQSTGNVVKDRPVDALTFLRKDTVAFENTGNGAAESNESEGTKKSVDALTFLRKDGKDTPTAAAPPSGPLGVDALTFLRKNDGKDHGGTGSAANPGGGALSFIRKEGKDLNTSGGGAGAGGAGGGAGGAGVDALTFLRKEPADKKATGTGAGGVDALTFLRAGGSNVAGPAPPSGGSATSGVLGFLLRGSKETNVSGNLGGGGSIREKRNETARPKSRQALKPKPDRGDRLEISPLSERHSGGSSERYSGGSSERYSGGPGEENGEVGNPKFYQRGEEDTFTQFQFIGKLGSSTMGVVYRAVHKVTGKELAIKSLPMDLKSQEALNLKREMETLKTCNHPNLVSYLGCAGYGLDALWLLMEFCPGGSVADRIRGVSCQKVELNEFQISCLCKSVVRGLEYLHQKGLGHKDLKSGNILLGENGAKLTDYGRSIYHIDSMRTTSVIGTPVFMPPEVFSNKPQSLSVDVWALGITCIEMAEGRPPNSDKPLMQIMFSIVEGHSPTLKDPAKWSEGFQQFIDCCLRKVPETRPSPSTLLEHPFLSNLTDEDLSGFFGPFQQEYEQQRHRRTGQSNTLAGRKKNALSNKAYKIVPTQEMPQTARSLKDAKGAEEQREICNKLSDSLRSFNELENVMQALEKPVIKWTHSDVYSWIEYLKTNKIPEKISASLIHQSPSGSTSRIDGIELTRLSTLPEVQEFFTEEISKADCQKFSDLVVELMHSTSNPRTRSPRSKIEGDGLSKGVKERMEILSTSMEGDAKQVQQNTALAKKEVEEMKKEMQEKSRRMAELRSKLSKLRPEAEALSLKAETAAALKRRSAIHLLVLQEQMRRFFEDGATLKQSPLAAVDPEALVAAKEGLVSIIGSLYNYEELLQTDLSALNKRCLEQYLDENEFNCLFGMSKDGFVCLPEWMQQCRKKQLHLIVE